MTTPSPHSSTERIVFLGDTEVGKTSIISRQIHGTDPTDIISTLGCRFSVTAVPLPTGIVSLQIWDTAGQEVYRSLAPIYIRGARLAVFVFDLTQPDSFEALQEWINLALESLIPGTPFVVVGNKLDLTDSIRVPSEAIEKVSRKYDVPVFRTSAKTGFGIEGLFAAIAEIIVKTPVPDEIRELAEAEKREEKSCC
jgi:small GTP-binding protein